MQKRFWFLSALAVALISISFFWTRTNQSEVVHTIYGDTVVTEPVLLDLIHSQAFTRLQYIRQYGVDDYIHATKVPYSRYTHSLGVFYLLRTFGAPLKEQIAGLLHDVSHTVFSHVGDHVAAQMNKTAFNQNDEAYQDCVHVSYLKQTDIADILARHAIAIQDMDHKNGTYPMLERDLPEICADRLEYVIYGGYAEGWLTEDDVKAIIAAVAYEDGKWVFTDVEKAKQFAGVSIRLCEEIFASEWNVGSYEWAAKALLHAAETGLISMQDIHFGTDDVVWKKLQESDDEYIKTCLQKIIHAQSLYASASKESYDLRFIAKFRGINPWVAQADECVRLTECDNQFNQYYADAKERVTTEQFFKEIVL